VVERKDYGSLQAAVALDKESGLALLAGRLLLALLELAVPVKVQVLQDVRNEGRNIRAFQREEPDDLHQARQELEALLTQIQPEPYKFYERWEVLLSSDRGTRRTGALIRTGTMPPTPKLIRPSIRCHGTQRCCAWRKCRWNCRPARR
jgi:hypothetical protein